MVMPGDNVSVVVKVIAPVAMERDQRFAIREGGRTIGAGRVTEVSNSRALENAGSAEDVTRPPFCLVKRKQYSLALGR